MDIITFVEQLNNKFQPESEFSRVYTFTEGKRYYKICTASQQTGKLDSAYAFVDKTTGDLYKSASWNAPATKHIRGNINDSSSLAACNRYSVIYLR
jgi:hypothetical protein